MNVFMHLHNHVYVELLGNTCFFWTFVSQMSVNTALLQLWKMTLF